MKLVGKRLVSAALGLLLVLSLMACGGEVTVQDYLETDEFQQEMESIKTQVESQGLTVEVNAQGNTLTYVYTYLQEYTPDELAMIREAMEMSASTIDALLKEVYDSVSQAVSKPEDVVVVMTYCSSAGEEIITFRYPA